MVSELAEDIVLAGEAENVEQAVTLIRSEKPDLVFLDIEMPGKSGLQLVDEFSRTHSQPFLELIDNVN